MSMIPPACSRSIRSAMELSVPALIPKKKTADYADVTDRNSRERTRPACWFRRRAETAFLLHQVLREELGEIRRSCPREIRGRSFDCFELREIFKSENFL